ncbi:MAG: hypothetical protein H0V17_20750, partial [Deltaproteobacteria bacterium]|nr:hypothetical protein [Deltaproteobacteria bacterium]
QTVDPAPREFTARIAAKGKTPVNAGSNRPPTQGSGGINTWDRFNGSQRDDPNR